MLQVLQARQQRGARAGLNPGGFGVQAGPLMGGAGGGQGGNQQEEVRGWTAWTDCAMCITSEL